MILRRETNIYDDEAIKNSIASVEKKVSATYGTCSTAANTVAKVVTLEDFVLFKGAQISVQFTNANTASAPTMNVNSTGAKAIWARGAAIAATYYWSANSTHVFTYDGTHWVMENAESQEEALKRLTNNYQNAGLYLENGALYMNATYIKTGNLLANLITAGKIQSANGQVYFDLDNNEMACNYIVGYDSTLAINRFTSGGVYYAYSVYYRYSAATGINMIPAVNSTAWSGITSANGLKISANAASSFNTDQNATLRLGTPSVADTVKLQANTNTYMIMRANPGNAAAIIIDSPNQIRIEAGVYVGGSLTCTGTKPRLVTTKDYGERYLYCYETPSPLFGDVGEGVISEDGKCYVWIDNIFAETVTLSQYQVFLQKYGEGDCWISQKTPSYFVVEGTPNMSFGWEIKAKQSDFDQYRLEKETGLYSKENTHNYAEELTAHIAEIRSEREVNAA